MHHYSHLPLEFIKESSIVLAEQNGFFAYIDLELDYLFDFPKSNKTEIFTDILKTYFW